MNKLEMAHEYVMNYISNPSCENATVSSIVSLACSYADLMQDEADKRKSKPELPSLQQTFIDGVEQPRYAPPCEEWQPDWSQSPYKHNYWAVDKDGFAFWHEKEPFIDDIEFYSYDFKEAPSFNYQGNWQDSLRKRPQ